MLSIKNISLVAAFAGLAVALPTPAEDAALVERQWHGAHQHWKQPENVVWVTITETAGAPTVATATAVYTPPAAVVPSAAPVAASSSSAAPAVASSGATGYMAIVSKYRAAGGLPALTQDSTLEANALKTSTDSVGGLKHELNPGSMAQVLAPGNPNNFESVYVGGWLCEIPTLPGLDGICSTASQGWSHDGQTGHAKILTGSYSKIGCSISSNTNVWACDLA
ncbi:hypothetical protein A1O1_05614 [Capronia coronata CBS 617.96]|uniref:SCP domain-containing protein n=1 Tax=Capronia coronata CBS 617.96 TaxID=1182541 RepID=W9Y820_9EURO|nr:uncharacterized protein A1O1_05614 [Capronia coronata CBS 617.96]EXJ88683.1 hypothetical protein A1O1_05614 [Capronia coronata CBS 617.96]